MRRRPKQDPVDPLPPMPRGETEFEEALMKRDFVAVFKRISDAYWNDVTSPVEYAYRAGYVAGKSRREVEQARGSIKLPNYIQIL